MLLRVNVGGTGFAFMEHRVRQYPETLLGLLVTRSKVEILENHWCDAFLDKSQEYFFDRSPVLFEIVACFYRTGVIHKPDNLCLDAFAEELLFFRIIPEYPDALCIHCGICVTNSAFRLHEERNKNVKSKKSSFETIPEEGLIPLCVTDGVVFSEFGANGKNRQCQAAVSFSVSLYRHYLRFRNAVWNVVAKPESSSLALVFSGISVVFIVATVAVMTCESLPMFAICDANSTLGSSEGDDDDDKSCCCSSNGHFSESTTAVSCDNPQPEPRLVIIDRVVIAWFTFEYLIRLWAAPKRWPFFKESMTIIDLMSILPFYIEQVLTVWNVADRNSLAAARGIRIIRLFRILRLLKLSRYSKGMQLLGLSLRRSAAELGLMLFYTMLTTMFFSSLLYFVELGAKKTAYTTIPDAAWWSMVSLFGYADAPPVTIGGKFVAAAGTMAGVILLALPITIIVDKFGRTYEEVNNDGHGVRRKRFRTVV